jgi:hypothetical protein
MEIRRKAIIAQQVRYLKATMGVRYYVDCEYSTDNGKTWNADFEDTDEESERVKNLTPCVVKSDIGYGTNDYLELTIDLNNGKVLNWKDGFCLKTHYKVCDDSEYIFLDKDTEEVVNITKEYNQYYVPDFLSLEDEGYGDYVYLNINGDGTIEHFERMKKLIKEYFENVNNERV